MIFYNTASPSSVFLDSSSLAPRTKRAEWGQWVAVVGVPFPAHAQALTILLHYPTGQLVKPVVVQKGRRILYSSISEANISIRGVAASECPSLSCLPRRALYLAYQPLACWNEGRPNPNAIIMHSAKTGRQLRCPLATPWNVVWACVS